MELLLPCVELGPGGSANFLPVRYCANTVSMATQETVTARKRRGPKPTGKGVNIGVRLQPEQLAALDAWIASQPKLLSRPEALRRLAARGMPSTTEVNVSDEQHSWGGDAVMTAPKPRKLK